MTVYTRFHISTQQYSEHGIIVTAGTLTPVHFLLYSVRAVKVLHPKSRGAVSVNYNAREMVSAPVPPVVAGVYGS